MAICSKCKTKVSNTIKKMCPKCYDKDYKLRNREHRLEIARLYRKKMGSKLNEYYHKNKPILALKNKIYRSKILKADPLYFKRIKVMSRFGMTLDEYSKMIVKQKNLCAICFKACDKNKNLSIDHNHTTGKVRGLLCNLCNAMIGFSKENITNLQNAIKYLRKHEQSNTIRTIGTYARIEKFT